MARSFSKIKMGYLPIEPRHHEAILSLVQPAHPGYKIIDPFAGEGEFLEAAARQWNLTPYSNELDQDRAEKCVERFGPKQAVRGDAMRLRASNKAFAIGWINPPYDHDRAEKGNKRVEFTMLRHSWKWIQVGGLVMWCVYRSHVTEAAMAFFAQYATDADIWALPGKHQGQYDQIVLVATVGPGQSGHELATYNKLQQQKQNPRPLTMQPEPLYKLPAPVKDNRFYFAPDNIDHATGQTLVETYGAFANQGFQTLLSVPQVAEQSQPLVMPRPGHTALVLSAGVANGAVIETMEYGEVALRSKIEIREEIARVETEEDPQDPERVIKKTTMRLRPATQLTLLAQDGNLVEMEGDDALLSFIKNNRTALAQYMNTKFDPLYTFDFAGIKPYLDRIRLKGKYPLYTPQKHVVAAIAAGFRTLKGQLLIGQMGTGKTAIGGSAAIAIAGQIVQEMQPEIGDDQVVLIICPPHLIDKWKRELHSINPNIFVEHLKRHEDVKAFMSKAKRIGRGIPKIGLIKRDMTKLGSGFEPAVVWRTKGTALWGPHASIPDGYEAEDRIHRQRIPLCPCCGTTVTYERKGTTVVATQTWLNKGQRDCAVCHTPLWQETRDKSSRPKKGYKYPEKNPRYRLDAYLKKVYPERVYLLIWDEIHEASNGDTGNGEAFGRLANISHKILGLTGTPFNGRASSMFNVEYHLNPQTRDRYPWGGSQRFSRKARGSHSWQAIIDGPVNNQRGRAESAWVADMGVREQVLEERPTYNQDTGVFTGTTTYERPYQEAPGCSPMLIGWLLGHSVFFSLKDIGKHLPKYTEIAYPVPMDEDLAGEYDRTRDKLRDYLVQRRWEGDVSFRGAYLQWSMGWCNAPFRPTDVIHNIKSPITNKKQPHVVTTIPSYDPDGDRIFAKEQALIDLVQAKLDAGRPVVIYARQTATKDIQPRIEKLIREHVPQAKPYILRNTVSAERREKVIEQQIAAGINVLICNPELVKTGLDLLAFVTLIYYEIVFNLSTMLQAASRSYRLNQEQDECEVIYMFYEGTMEHTAVQLMSRKQRAAKILTGDTGLTGLDSLTEGEGGFEAALLNAITESDTLIDPRDLFTQDAIEDEITSADNAFWNVESPEDTLPIQDLRTFDPAIIDSEPQPVVDPIPVATNTSSRQPKSPPMITTIPSTATSAQKHLASLVVSDTELHDILSMLAASTPAPADELVQFAIDELGAVVAPDIHNVPVTPTRTTTTAEYTKQQHYVEQYLEQYPTNAARRKWLVELLMLIRNGVWDDVEDVQKVVGIEDDYYLQSEAMQKRLQATVRSHLRRRKLVPPDALDEAALQVIDLSLMALGKIPLKLDIFAALRVNQKAEIDRRVAQDAKPRKRKKKAPLDLMAIPDDEATSPATGTQSASDDRQLKQLAFF